MDLSLATQIYIPKPQRASSKRLKSSLELTAEIAKLEAQKSWTGIGNGAINSAIDTVRGLIGQLQGMGYSAPRPTGTDGMIVPDANNNQQIVNNGDTLRYYVDMNKAGQRVGGPGKPIREDNLQLLAEGSDVGLYLDGNRVELTYDPGGKRVALKDGGGATVWVAFTHGRSLDKDGNQVDQFFEGTDYVERGNNPVGRDTIPAMVNEGERILPTRLNQLLGGAKLSNEHLVDKVLAFEKLTAAFPQMAINTSFPQMRLPAHIMNGNSGGSFDVSGLRSDLKEVKAAIQSQKLLSVNMDEHGFTKSIIGKQSKTVLIQSLLTR